MAAKVLALYVSTPRYGVNGISLHATAEEAYAALVEFLRIGYEDDPKYADGAVPQDLDELIEWCEERGNEQGTEWYCTDVELPTSIEALP